MVASMKTSLIQGAFFTVATRWTDRVIGLVSTLVLARLLAPFDFGIIAMSSLVIGLIDVFFDLGVNVALIQNKSATKSHFDAAWTLRLIQSFFATVIVAISAPLAAKYFGNPKIAPVLQVLSISFILGGLENIGIVEFQKNIQFGQEFRFLFLRRITGVATTLVMAYIIRSYWALVIGTLVGRSSGVLLSFILHPMRPKLCIKKMQDIFSISQWVLVRNIGGYLEFNLHKFIVGRRESAAIMGAYGLADEISALPSTELLAPINRVLFPAFVQAKGNSDELKRIFLLSMGLQGLICIPAGIGLALVADEAVRILLGEKWLISIPFVQILSLINVVISIMSSAGYVLITLNRIHVTAIYAWVQIVMFSSGAFLVFPNIGGVGVAWLRLGVSIIGLFVFGGILIRALPNILLREVFSNLFRPLLASIAMAAIVISLNKIANLTHFVSLTIKVFTGIISYTLSIISLWFLSGKPQGAETYIINKLSRDRLAVE